MNSLKWKERKGGKETEREKEREKGERERERRGSEWVRERGRPLKRGKERVSEREREIEREREGSERGREKQMYQNCIPTMNMNTLCDLRITSIHFCQFMKRNKR